jgi:hypothetical protein
MVFLYIKSHCSTKRSSSCWRGAAGISCGPFVQVHPTNVRQETNQVNVWKELNPCLSEWSHWHSSCMPPSVIMLRKWHFVHCPRQRARRVVHNVSLCSRRTPDDGKISDSVSRDTRPNHHSTSIVSAMFSDAVLQEMLRSQSSHELRRRIHTENEMPAAPLEQLRELLVEQWDLIDRNSWPSDKYILRYAEAGILLEIRVLQGFFTNITNPYPKGFSSCEKTLKFFC